MKKFKEINMLEGEYRCVRLSPNLINPIDVFVNVDEPYQRINRYASKYDISEDSARYIDLFYTLLWANGPNDDVVHLGNAVDFYRNLPEDCAHRDQLDNTISKMHRPIAYEDAVSYWESITQHKPIKESI